MCFMHAMLRQRVGLSLHCYIYKGVHPIFFAGTGFTLLSHSTAMAGVTLFIGPEHDHILYVQYVELKCIR